MKFFIDTANIDEIKKAHALGMMACALSASDKTLAGKLMQEAFALLDAFVGNGSTRRMPTPQDVALSLLPVVEGINPEVG